MNSVSASEVGGRSHGGRFVKEGNLAGMLIGMSTVFIVCQAFKLIPGKDPRARCTLYTVLPKYVPNYTINYDYAEETLLCS